MTDHVLSCREVFEFFDAEVASAGSGSLLPEGAQNAFVNMYSRLARDCPASSCDQLDGCVLHVDGAPKRFDGADGKVRFLRMKVRTEGLRTHRRRGRDVLTGEHVALVDDLDAKVRPSAPPDAMEVLAVAAERDAALADALDSLRSRIGRVDLGAVRGGYDNVAAAARVASALVERTGSAPVPEGIEERRDAVRALLVEAAPWCAEGSPATVRQRQKRIRAIVREVLTLADGAYLADVWVPLEQKMQRGAAAS